MAEKPQLAAPSTYADRLQHVIMVIAPLLARDMRSRGIDNLEQWLLLSGTGVEGVIELPLATKDKPVMDPEFRRLFRTEMS